MTFGFFVGDVIRICAITLVSEIAMNALEQKDFARLIKFTGASGIASDVVTYLNYLNTHPPLLLTMTKESASGWSNFLRELSNFGTQIKNFYSLHPH